MSDDLKEEVKAKVLQYIAGTALETNKLEFKRKWYDLKDSKQKNEFFKDTTALINYYGGDNGFIVFGIDEDTKDLYDTSLSESGYDDQADIKNIVDSNIDKPFRFDIDYVQVNGKRLSVFHLVPSTDKPHVILKYQDKKGQNFVNEIFTRSGSAKVVAGKADIDRMYIERNTIIVERKAEVSINLNKFHAATSESANTIYFSRLTTIENLGTRVLSIYRIHIRFQRENVDLLFYYETVVGNPFIVQPSQIETKELKFIHRGDGSGFNAKAVNDIITDLINHAVRKNVSCYLTLASGETLPVILNLPNISQGDKGGVNAVTFH